MVQIAKIRMAATNKTPPTILYYALLSPFCEPAHLWLLKHHRVRLAVLSVLDPSNYL